jgi:hypothetical protein
MSKLSWSWSVSLALVSLMSSSARADEGETTTSLVDRPAPTPGTVTKAEAAAGTFLPFTQTGVVDFRRAFAAGFAGYDTARKSGSFEALAEVHLWGPIALRGGAVYTNAGASVRPSIGARVQALREGRHGVDGALGVFYRPEGLTEPEGEVESVLSIGRHVGPAYLAGNVLYGQDPEGNERDGELRLAAIGPATARLLVGFDSRLRFDLGSNAAKLAAHNEATFDVLAGPVASVVIGPVALSLQGGASGVRLQQHNSYGAFVMTGVGTAF